MFFFLIVVYSISLFFVLFDFNVLFINEEFLTFISMSILFFLLVASARKFVNFTFFLRIEFIYFFFIYLILLNIKLIEKMLNLISMENLKLDTLILAELYNFFLESVNELSNSEKLVNLFLTKNIILLINSNIFSSLVLPHSSDYLIKFVFNKGSVLQHFELKDINYFFTINRKNLSNTAKFLINSVLYDSYSTSIITSDFSNLNLILENNEISKVLTVDDLDLFVEAGTFNKNFISFLIV